PPFDRAALVGLLPLGGLGVDLGGDDPAGHALSGGEWRVELDAEPGPELLGIGNRVPHALARRAKQDALLDTIAGHMQPPGCSIYERQSEAQPTSCTFGLRAGARSGRVLRAGLEAPRHDAGRVRRRAPHPRLEHGAQRAHELVELVRLLEHAVMRPDRAGA